MRFRQKLAVWLAERQLHKMEKQAAQRIATAEFKEKRELKFMDAIADPQEYMATKRLIANLRDLNNPWQGVLNPYFTLGPKSHKDVEPFPPFEPSPKDMWGNPAVEQPLTPEQQEWLELPVDEFYERLNQERVATF